MTHGAGRGAGPMHQARLRELDPASAQGPWCVAVVSVFGVLEQTWHKTGTHHAPSRANIEFEEVADAAAAQQIGSSGGHVLGLDRLDVERRSHQRPGVGMLRALE